MRKLVQCVGINDATYKITLNRAFKDEYGKTKKEQVWMCPFYKTWKSMLVRCYSKKYQKYFPRYIGVRVCKEWLKFSNFKSWMEKQDWEGKQLDKDLMCDDEKFYSPETCIFISADVNKFLNGYSSVSDLKGVVKYDNKKFRAATRTTSEGRRYLGYFETELDAHLAWLDDKIKQVDSLECPEYVKDIIRNKLQKGIDHHINSVRSVNE